MPDHRALIQKGYSIVEIKAISDEDDERIIRGWATTPTPDRVDDVVVAEGVKSETDIPLFLYHEYTKTVGRAKLGKPEKKGIPFEARLPHIKEDGILKDRVDEAWQLVKYKLITGVSIGFRALNGAVEIMKNGGLRFLETEVLELSLVPVPANREATITAIKSLHAASGDRQKIKPPGVSGSVRITKPEDKTMAKKTYAEQIADLQATRKQKADRLSEMTEKTLDEGRTKDAAEREEFDTLKGEVDAVDREIQDLRDLEKQAARTATPVDDEVRRKAQAAVVPGAPSEPRGYVNVRNTQKLVPGIRFARFAKCLAIADDGQRRGQFVTADQVAKALYQHDDQLVALFQKAAVPAALTSTEGWAGALISDESGTFADFVEFLRPQTILGRFGANGVPSLRRVPFRTPLIGATSGGAGYWVGEAQAKGLTSFDFARTTLEPLKVANIAVASMEVLRDSSPSAEMLIRDGLASALRERMDIDFIDPTKTAVAGTSPASITNGATTVASSGTDADAVREDIRALFGAFIAANNAPTSGVWIMPATTALALSLMQNPLGQTEFPGLTMNGGTLFGLPAIISEYVPADTSGAIVALVNASDIYLADEGGINISMTREASLQMDSAPDNPTTAATVMVSLWQRNLVGFMAERTINWSRRRTSAVAYLTDVLWGSTST